MRQYSLTCDYHIVEASSCLVWRNLANGFLHSAPCSVANDCRTDFFCCSKAKPGSLSIAIIRQCLEHKAACCPGPPAACAQKIGPAGQSPEPDLSRACFHNPLHGSPSGRKTFSSLCPPPRQNSGAASGCLARPEAVPSFTYKDARLIGTFHAVTPFINQHCRVVSAAGKAQTSGSAKNHLKP